MKREHALLANFSKRANCSNYGFVLPTSRLYLRGTGGWVLLFWNEVGGQDGKTAATAVGETCRHAHMHIHALKACAVGPAM